MEQTIGPLVGALLIAVGIGVSYTDLRWNKIFNAVTFPMILGGIALNALPAGWGVGAGDWRFGAIGFAVGLGILFPSFALDLVKAGDVKYLAGIGAMGGWLLAGCAFLYGSIVHGLMCLVVLSKRGEVQAAFENIGYYFRNSLLAFKPIDFSARSQGHVPFALGLSAGCVVALVLQWTIGTMIPFWG